jgi:predicted nucleic acid-binding protein
VAQQKSIIAVADSSFLIGLCMIDQLPLIPKMVKQLYVTPTVWEEVVEQGKSRPAADELRSAAFVKVQQVRDNNAVGMLRVFLGKGEAESLVLAQEIRNCILFVDDLRARKMAQEASIVTMGVAGFLLAAKQKGFLSELRPLFKMLRERGFRLSNILINRILQEAGEVSGK